ncbi:porin [Pseudooceanicola sp.]|uniref:porin n=1 Tax=Pseudooceanicola sp. TaxID=1914328 RepID=UPI00260265C3|nr:porin [Pseudooceanicola sp.]MDF1855719.1 hypothetical protein [Pseudooceanicola sp.]
MILRPALILCLFAGPPALADPLIRFTGEARMGVTYDGSATRKTDAYGLAQIDTRIATTTDNGLEIGMQMRIIASSGGPSTASAPRFYITTGTVADLPRR